MNALELLVTLLAIMLLEFIVFRIARRKSEPRTTRRMSAIIQDGKITEWREIK